MKSRNVFIYLIALLLASIPLRAFTSTAILIILGGYTLFFAVKNKLKPNFTKESILFMVFYFWMVLSYLWTIDKPLTILGLERKIIFLVIPILFALMPKFNIKDRNKILYYFSLAMIGYALFFILMGLIHYLNTGSLENLSHHKLVSPLKLNRVYVSLFASVAFFYWLYIEKKFKIKIVALFILSIFVLLLSSKTIVITMLVTMFSFSFYKKQKGFFKRKYIVYLILIFGTLFISNQINPKFFSELLPRFKEVTTKQDFRKNYYFNGAELRILYTRFLFEYEKEQNILLTGFGLNTAQQKINEKCLKYNVPDGYGTSYNFHNQYNQTLAEIGIIGLFLLLYLIYLGFRNAILNKDILAQSVIIIFTILLSTETLFNRQRGMYFFLFMYFLLIQSKKNLVKK